MATFGSSGTLVAFPLTSKSLIYVLEKLPSKHLIESWKDKSGNNRIAYDESTGTSNDRPTLGNDSNNGRAALVFDGDDYLIMDYTEHFNVSLLNK